MKQSLLRFTSILIGCLMIVSCHERTRLRRITSQFIESRIIFPDNLYAVKKRIYGKADIAKLQEHKLIIYIDLKIFLEG